MTNIVQYETNASCKLTYSWDHGPKSDLFELFRYNIPFIPADENDSFNYPEDIVRTKTRVRGRGTSLSMTLSSEPGKACFLEGIAVQYVGEE